MLAELRRWKVAPPLNHNLKSTRLAKAAKRAYRKADRRLDAALQSSDDALLHRARKAAKRARYAAELTKPSFDSTSAKRKVEQYKKIQTILGDHQDSAVATGVLRQMGAAAGTTPGENGFTFGLLLRQGATARAQLQGRGVESSRDEGGRGHGVVRSVP